MQFAGGQKVVLVSLFCPELFPNLSGNFRAECPDGQAVVVLPLLSSNRLRQQFKLNSSQVFKKKKKKEPREKYDFFSPVEVAAGTKSLTQELFMGG